MCFYWSWFDLDKRTLNFIHSHFVNWHFYQINETKWTPNTQIVYCNLVGGGACLFIYQEIELNSPAASPSLICHEVKADNWRNLFVKWKVPSINIFIILIFTFCLGLHQSDMLRDWTDIFSTQIKYNRQAFICTLY